LYNQSIKGIQEDKYTTAIPFLFLWEFDLSIYRCSNH